MDWFGIAGLIGVGAVAFGGGYFVGIQRERQGRFDWLRTAAVEARDEVSARLDELEQELREAERPRTVLAENLAALSSYLEEREPLVGDVSQDAIAYLEALCGLIEEMGEGGASDREEITLMSAPAPEQSEASAAFQRARSSLRKKLRVRRTSAGHREVA